MNKENSAYGREARGELRRLIKRGMYKLGTLDTPEGKPDFVLGRALEFDGKEFSQFPETEMVRAHASLVKDLRGTRPECLNGYSYIREAGTDNYFCMTGLAQPGKVDDPNYEKTGLNRLVRDMPFTTIMSPGENIPSNQRERQEYFVKIMKGIKRCGIVMGGLLENRIAMEGVGTEMLKAMGNPEDTVIFVISHSGSENSYKEVDNLRAMKPEYEQRIIHNGIKRILELTGITKEQVVGMVGHSKGGWFVENEINTGEYPKAAVVELAMVVLGTRLSKHRKDWPEWLKKAYQNEKGYRNAVKIHEGPLGAIVKLALAAPDIGLRKVLVDVLGKWIAEYYIGQDAAYGLEAVAAIVHELKFNKQAIWAQQISLARMGAIVSDFTHTTSNPRFIASVRRDNTLEHEFQRLYKQERSIYDDSIKSGVDALIAAGAEKVLASPHNPNIDTIRTAAEWLARQILAKGTNTTPVTRADILSYVRRPIRDRS